MSEVWQLNKVPYIIGGLKRRRRHGITFTSILVVLHLYVEGKVNQRQAHSRCSINLQQQEVTFIGSLC